jgi:hypothetical protein
MHGGLVTWQAATRKFGIAPSWGAACCAPTLWARLKCAMTCPDTGVLASWDRKGSSLRLDWGALKHAPTTPWSNLRLRLAGAQRAAPLRRTYGLDLCWSNQPATYNILAM